MGSASSSPKVDRPSEKRAARSLGPTEKRPARDSRLNRLSSAFCLRTSRSRDELIASSELFEISKSKTLRSRRASAARSEMFRVGLRVESGFAKLFVVGGSKEVSIEGSAESDLPTRGMVADLTSCVNGDDVMRPSAVVADRRLD